MTKNLAYLLLFWLAFLLANLPFISNRLIGFLPLTSKGGSLRIIEMVIAYLLVGLTGVGLESTLGQVAPQGWQFYVVTFSLFLVLAFPGFIYRFLWHKFKF